MICSSHVAMSGVTRKDRSGGFARVHHDHSEHPKIGWPSALGDRAEPATLPNDHSHSIPDSAANTIVALHDSPRLVVTRYCSLAQDNL
jgi:hypothetical protein